MIAALSLRERFRAKPLVPIVAALGVVALVAGGIVLGSAVGSGNSSGEPTADAATQVSAAEDGNAAGAAGAYQDPTARESASVSAGATASRVEIPAIGVDSGLEQLELSASTGELTPPVEWLSAGWYRDGTVPGDIGPAVIAGHVDSVTKPAVFARLGELQPGDEIRVTLSTGDVETFRVDSQTAAPKDAFPTDLVYGPTPTPQLRLITCDGVFNGSTGHYLDNLIVFASLVA